MLSIAEISHAAQIAVLAAVFLLNTEDGHIFAFYGRWLDRMKWTLPWWVRKPLGACPRCFFGQVGLWSGVALKVNYLMNYFVLLKVFWPGVLLSIAIHTALVLYLGLTLYEWKHTND